MMSDESNALKQRMEDFELCITQMYSSMPTSPEAQVIGKLILRSGASAGSLCREGLRARSNAELISKLEDGLQELEETARWLELLSESNIAEASTLESLLQEAAMLAASVKAAKEQSCRIATHPSFINVAVVHYHARPGGVTRVVERAVESLGKNAHCLFFTGEAARGETPLQKKIREVPNLGYSTDKKLQSLELLRRARGAFGGEPDVWHIHNHCLGKNPALTQEVSNLAMAGQKMLLQIHDFAEDGRPDNYANLRKLSDRLYPVAEHIHYAALNQRDFDFLKAAGIPETNLHLLPNAVSPLPASQSLQPNAQSLFVYPCRAIRRKNIGELLLWSAAMPEAKFAVTLAPKNPEVKPIYDAWVAFAEELGLNVEFDAGAKLPFEEMMAKADALITTSIAEGFGLAFLEPWLAGKPLVGRNLPEITADFEQHGLDLSTLYNRLGVPLTSDAWDIGAQFFQTLEEKMRAACEAYGHAWSDERFEVAKRELVQDGTVDFGILNEELQRVIIRAAKENPAMFGDGLGDASAQVAHNRAVVEEAYGSDAYGAHLLSIYHDLLKAKSGSVRYADGQKLLDEFLNPARFNLLRT